MLEALTVGKTLFKCILTVWSEIQANISLTSGLTKTNFKTSTETRQLCPRTLRSVQTCKKTTGHHVVYMNIF